MDADTGAPRRASAPDRKLRRYAENEARHRRRLARAVPGNVGLGVALGLGFATLGAAWVLGLSALRGSAQFDQYGLSAWEIIGTYYAAGTIAGALVGLLRPLTTTVVGAAGVGALAGCVVYGACEVSISGWAAADFRGAAVLGVAMGGGMGLYHAARGR